VIPEGGGFGGCFDRCVRSNLAETRGEGMRGRITVLIALIAALATAGATAVTAEANGVTPLQLSAAGWTCIQPRLDPTLRLCTPPGVGLPPLPGTPGFEDRAPSYEFLVFEDATGAFIGTQHLLRPDIYEQGTPPCPQQPGGVYLYNPRNDLWSCTRT
jgi:hypothetical protein